MAPLPRLGKLLLALGAIGLIRLLPEVLQLSRITRAFALIVTTDAVLAFATAAVGEGVWRGKKWAPKLAMRTAGVVLGTSIGMVALMVRFIVAHPGVDFVGLARLLYYALAIALWPYGVRKVIVSAPEPSRKSLKVRFMLWLVFGVPLVLIVMAVFR
jgi:hypothetical protein